MKRGGLLSESRNGKDISDKYYDNSTLLSSISEAKMDEMLSGNGSHDENMSADILEDILDGSQSHSIINSREARYKRHD